MNRTSSELHLFSHSSSAVTCKPSASVRNSVCPGLEAFTCYNGDSVDLISGISRHSLRPIRSFFSLPPSKRPKCLPIQGVSYIGKLTTTTQRTFLLRFPTLAPNHLPEPCVGCYHCLIQSAPPQTFKNKLNTPLAYSTISSPPNLLSPYNLSTKLIGTSLTLYPIALALTIISIWNV